MILRCHSLTMCEITPWHKSVVPVDGSILWHITTLNEYMYILYVVYAVIKREPRHWASGALRSRRASIDILTTPRVSTSSLMLSSEYNERAPTPRHRKMSFDRLSVWNQVFVHVDGFNQRLNDDPSAGHHIHAMVSSTRKNRAHRCVCSCIEDTSTHWTASFNDIDSWYRVRVTIQWYPVDRRQSRRLTRIYRYVILSILIVPFSLRFQTFPEYFHPESVRVVERFQVFQILKIYIYIYIWNLFYIIFWKQSSVTGSLPTARDCVPYNCPIIQGLAKVSTSRPTETTFERSFRFPEPILCALTQRPYRYPYERSPRSGPTLK